MFREFLLGSGLFIGFGLGEGGLHEGELHFNSFRDANQL